MKAAVLAFIRTVFWGSVAGGGPFLIITLPLVISAWSPFEPATILLALFPLLIAAGVVVGALLLLAIPLTALLHHLGRERSSIYSLAGLICGILLPIATVVVVFDGEASSGAFFSIPGALAGLVSASIWGHWREETISSGSGGVDASTPAEVDC